MREEGVQSTSFFCNEVCQQHYYFVGADGDATLLDIPREVTALWMMNLFPLHLLNVSMTSMKFSIIYRNQHFRRNYVFKHKDMFLRYINRMLAPDVCIIVVT